MEENKQVKLEPFKKEEADKVLALIQEVLVKNGAEIVVRPILNDNGTIAAQAQIFKKVQEPVKSPDEFLPTNDNGGEKGTNSSEEKKAD